MQPPKSIPSLSKKRKHLKILEEKNKQTKHTLDSEDQTFKLRPSLSNKERYLKIPREEKK